MSRYNMQLITAYVRKKRGEEWRLLSCSGKNQVRICNKEDLGIQTDTQDNIVNKEDLPRRKHTGKIEQQRIRPGVRTSLLNSQDEYPI